MYAYDPLLKQQNTKWRKKGSTPPLKAKVQKSATKVKAIMFFDHHWMVYFHFVHPSHTVNAYYYKGVLEKLIRVHIPQGGCSKLHHDNAPMHTTKIIRAFLEKKKVEVMPHPAYSLMLPPTTFFCTRRWKKVWKDGFFHQLKGSKQLYRANFCVCQRVALKRSSRSGRNVGKSVRVSEGNILNMYTINKNKI